jgi:hypothetical protein
MSALIPELQAHEVAEDPRPRRTTVLLAAALIGLVLLVLAAVVVGILVTWAMIQPVLPDPTGPAVAPRSEASAVLSAAG